MRRIQVIPIMICMILMGCSTGLLAQSSCGGTNPFGSTLYCCGTKIFVEDEWAPTPQLHMGQTLTQCRFLVPGCYESYVVAEGTCTVAALSTPEMRKRLDLLSQQTPLLVASCTGGLVPYQPRRNADFPDGRGFNLKPRKLDLGGIGE
jgi:hypothetical protein